jgi:hypothetical protein
VPLPQSPASPPQIAQRLRETARRLSEAEVEVVNLRARCQAMAMELASERKRAGDAEAMAASVRSAARSAVASVGSSGESRIPAANELQS